MASPYLGRFIWRESMSQDVSKTKAFYGGLFGWTFQDMDMGPMGTYTIIKNGPKGPEDRGIGGIMAMRPDQKQIPTHWASYAYVADVDASIAAAQKNGGKAHWGPMDVPNVGRMAGIEAFDGAMLAIMKPSQPDMPYENARPPVGAFCWETLTTADIDRAKQFWTAVLPWKPSSGAGQPTFSVGDGMENQVADIQKAQGGVPPNWLTFVLVPKIEPSCDEATKLGGKVMMPATVVPKIGRIAVVLDDQRAAIGLFEPAAG
jgi:predicted enzyme related to lactoylglutathione lyase